MLQFTYQIADFVNNAKMLSLYRASSAFNNASVDDIALNKEDESIIKKYLISACFEVANAMAGYTTDLYDDADVLQPPYEMDDLEIAFRVNMPTYFNTSYIEPINHAIGEILENYVLQRVYKNRSVEFASFHQDYEFALGNLKFYLSRRTQSIQRNFRTI